MKDINLNQTDLGILAICAIRFCQGRQSYMFHVVREVIRPHLDKLKTTDLWVMLEDCEDQEKEVYFDLYGDDKPGWIKWKKEIEAELERRQNND